MQAVILAAGMGTRLRPVTLDRSKAMVPVLGRPLAERAMMPFAENGVRDFVFVVSAEDTEIRPYFGEQTTLDISAQFVVQHERLGMAHALGLAAPFLTGRFALSACDSLVSRPHVRKLLEAAEDADAVLSLLDVEPELLSRSAVVELDGNRVHRIVEKPALKDAPSRTVSLPHYVFSPSVLDLLSEVKKSPRGEFELQDAIQGLIERGGRVVGVRAVERFQVSTPEDLLSLTRQVLSQEQKEIAPGESRVGRKSRLIGPLHAETGVEIGEGCVLGPEVYLESGCRIGDRAVIRRSIVLRGGRVAAGETVEDRVVT